MSRREYRKLLWGAGLLGGSALLTELLTFRLVAAAIGHGFAMFGGVTAPGAAAFGAMVLARRSSRRTGHELDRTAAHFAALAGTFAVLAVIGLTLVSQKIARAQGAGEIWHVAVGLMCCWLPAMFGGAAVATVARRGAARIGRVLSVTALGAVLACLIAPWLMDLGGPRAAILNGLPFGVAALLLASAGKPAKPKIAMIATLPLAVFALLAGDVGAPWLKMRFDLGRRSRIDHTMWSPQGLIAVQKVKRDKTRLHVDRGEPVSLAEKPKARRKPAFEPQDLVYLTSDGDPGPVLIVGSAGGREIAVALAYEHPRVDVIELHASFVNDVLLDRYATVTGHVLQRGDEVTAQIGDGRAGLMDLPRDYQHVVVQAFGTFDQTAPRLLSRHDRLHTRQAIAAYLDRLRDDGSLLIRARKEGLPSLVVAASAALGQDPGMARDHLLACADDVDAVLLVQVEAMAPSELYNLEKRCKRSRLSVEYPLKQTRSLRDPEKAAQEREAKLARLESGRAASDDRPFLQEPPSIGELGGAAWASLKALKPVADVADKPSPKKKTGEGDAAGAEAPRDERPEMAATGVAAAGLGVVVLLVLMGLLVPPPRRREASTAASARAPLALRGSFVLLGIAMALGFFVLDDVLLRVTGDAAYAWTFVIPLGMVGVGAGQLWVDVVSPERLRRATAIGLAVGAAWLALLAGTHTTVLGWVDTGLAFRLTASMFVLVVTGWQLGWPLAAGLKTMAVWERAGVTWAWGAHLGGWALGGAMAATLVPLTGVAALGWVAVAAFVLGSVAMSLGQRRDPAGGWVVRPAPTVPEVAPPSSSPMLGG